MIKKFTATPNTPLEAIALRHSLLMAQHPNMYFELAEMRGTGPNAWLTTEDRADNPEREVIEYHGGSSLIDAMFNLAGQSNNELPSFVELGELFTELVDSHSYAYFLLYAKPKEGWVLKISTHHTLDHSQYELLVSVTTDNLHDTLEQGLEKLKSIEL